MKWNVCVCFAAASKTEKSRYQYCCMILSSLIFLSSATKMNIMYLMKSTIYPCEYSRTYSYPTMEKIFNKSFGLSIWDRFISFRHGMRLYYFGFLSFLLLLLYSKFRFFVSIDSAVSHVITLNCMMRWKTFIIMFDYCCYSQITHRDKRELRLCDNKQEIQLRFGEPTQNDEEWI